MFWDYDFFVPERCICNDRWWICCIYEKKPGMVSIKQFVSGHCTYNRLGTCKRMCNTEWFMSKPIFLFAGIDWFYNLRTLTAMDSNIKRIVSGTVYCITCFCRNSNDDRSWKKAEFLEKCYGCRNKHFCTWIHHAHAQSGGKCFLSGSGCRGI